MPVTVNSTSTDSRRLPLAPSLAGAPYFTREQAHLVLLGQFEQLLAELPVQLAHALRGHVLQEVVQGLAVGPDPVRLGLGALQVLHLAVEMPGGVLEGLLGLLPLLGGVREHEDGDDQARQGQEGAAAQAEGAGAQDGGHGAASWDVARD